MANLSRKAISVLSVLIIGLLPALAAAQVPDLDFQKTLPITLDAESSEFDRKNSRLRFTGLEITQGDLRIIADEAEATRLDFENNQWEFWGNVVIESADTKAYCDRAKIIFDDHQVTNAILTGEPARFEQVLPEDEKLTKGRANQLEYDLSGATIKLIDDAWLSDGANEVSGAKITYDLDKEFILADADDTGPVRMKFTPPENMDTESLQ